MSQIYPSSEPGCYYDRISYNATEGQIVELINISENCEQRILLNCTNNRLTNFGWWGDRNLANRQYWHGDYGDDVRGCFCHLEGDGCTSQHSEVSNIK